MGINWNTATSDEILREIRKVRDYMVSQGGPAAAPTVINTPKGWFSLEPVCKQIKVKKGPGKYRNVAVVLSRL